MRVHAGADVGSREIVVAAAAEGSKTAQARFGNDAEGHDKLIRFLRKLGLPIRIALESTGTYGLDAAVALHRAGIEVMVANPRAVAHFARALQQRSKTDALDALTLLEYVRRMEFVPWQPPAQNRFELRALQRRIRSLKAIIVQEKNRRHASSYARELTTTVESDIAVNIRHLTTRCALLEKKALAIVTKDPDLLRIYELLVSVKGIGRTSALHLSAELALLPPDMTARQLVAHAGLDPRQHESGTSVHKPAHISRAGNKHLRAALFLPATVAVRHDTNIRAFFDRLLARGKHALQAYVAVMRKLLHAIHAMLRSNSLFDSSRFSSLA